MSYLSMDKTPGTLMCYFDTNHVTKVSDAANIKERDIAAERGTVKPIPSEQTIHETM